MSEEPWPAAASALARALDDRLHTQAEFEASLDALLATPSSPFSHAQARIERPAPFSTLELGSPGEGDSAHREPLQLERTGDSGQLDCWTKESTSVSSRDLRALSQLVARYYAGPRRTSDKTRMLAVDRGLAPAVVQAVEHMSSEHGAASLVFADLDKMGDLNAELGEAQVDGIILQIAALLEEAASPDALALHRSGDEFFLVCPGHAERAIDLTWRVTGAIAETEFPATKTGVSMSFGVVTVEKDDTSWTSLGDLETRAEEALKPPVQEEAQEEEGTVGRTKARRGHTSLAVAEHVGPGPDVGLSQDGLRDLAIAIVRSQAGSARPFSDPWLNAFSERVCGLVRNESLSWDERSERLAHFVAWIAPSFDEGRSAAASVDIGHSEAPVVSSFDLALGAAHGVLRAGLLGASALEGVSPESTLVAQTGTGDSFAVTIDDDRKLAVGGGPFTQDVEVGGLLRRVAGLDPAEIETRRALLVRIGHSRLAIEDRLFADVIVVDDRPTDGGGLPDFWEASVARVVDRLTRYPDIRLVAILGDTDLGNKTTEQLLSAAAWPEASEELSYRTGLTETAIRSVTPRLVDHVQSFSDAESLVKAVREAVLDSAELEACRPGALAPRSERFLDLSGGIEQYELPPHSGCKVATASQAYPLVLQILRDAADDDTVEDAAGIEMTDLIDFKVLITEPHHGLTPDFYRSDEDLLEAYFQRVFLDADGLFASRWADQLERMGAHLVHAITGPHPFSTRRAILVVPHVPEPVTGNTKAHDVRPLGLVSVRVIPRATAGATRLHFSFTWRTVEALVGFPYSLYGSLRFSCHLTDQLRDAVKAVDPTQRVELADVSYVAHSLHLTTDAYGQNIARRIAQMATR